MRNGHIWVQRPEVLYFFLLCFLYRIKKREPQYLISFSLIPPHDYRRANTKSDPIKIPFFRELRITMRGIQRDTAWYSRIRRGKLLKIPFSIFRSIFKTFRHCLSRRRFIFLSDRSNKNYSFPLLRIERTIKLCHCTNLDGKKILFLFTQYKEILLLW